MTGSSLASAAAQLAAARKRNRSTSPVVLAKRQALFATVRGTIPPALDPVPSPPAPADKCCDCTPGSACRTRRCVCFANHRPCMNCDCGFECLNLLGPLPPLETRPARGNSPLPPSHDLPGSSTPSDSVAEEALANLVDAPLPLNSDDASTSSSVPEPPMHSDGMSDPSSIDEPTNASASTPLDGTMEADVALAPTVEGDDPPPIGTDDPPPVGNDDQPPDGDDDSPSMPPSPPPPTIPAADNPPSPSQEANQLLHSVYGDSVHQDAGFDLDGGIADDALWHGYWRRLVAYPSQRYDLPRHHRCSRWFLENLADLLDGIVDRKWNSNRFLVFQLVILQRVKGVSRARDIKTLLLSRLAAWDDGNFDMLVETAELNMKSYLSSRQGTTTPSQRHSIFHKKMLRGEIRSAVRYLTEREQGGVLLPSAIDPTSGHVVSQVLEAKHPQARIPEGTAFPDYPTLPAFQEVLITDEVVQCVAARLSGAAGAGGTDSHALSRWLMVFGDYSSQLRRALARFTEWLANGLPDWAAYRELMGGRLLALDKCPGVRPIGIGETWRRASAKCLLRVAGPAAKEACGSTQLCAGLEAGIEGAVHSMQQLCDQHLTEEHWGFLLIDASNGFNELNRHMMLWTIRHEWPAGARFAFNCYKYWSPLVLRGHSGGFSCLFSKEGITQGDPLSMVLYGLALLPLIRHLHSEHPHAAQQWYADDAGVAGSFDALQQYFASLQELGPKYGYYPSASKCILIVAPEHIASASESFADSQFQIKPGARYLGGFIGSQEAYTSWIGDKISFWTDAIGALAQAAHKYPQTTYAAMQKSLQQEWQYVQRVVKNTSNSFTPVEEALHQVFLAALFGDSLSADDSMRRLMALPVKSSGLGLPNPTQTAQTNYSTSVAICSHLLDAFNGSSEFSTVDHTTAVQEAKQAHAASLAATHDAELASVLDLFPAAEKRIILRGKTTGQWLSVHPSSINGTQLSATEFRDALLMRYAHTPGNLPSKCDGCGQKFDLRHALVCKRGGLVTSRHNEITAELRDLALLALPGSAVRFEPRIHLCRATGSSVANDSLSQSSDSAASHSGERGDLLIRGLWSRGTDCILDVRVTDTDCKTYCRRDPMKVLDAQERAKKHQYLQACHDQRRDFAPFVVSTDGLLGREAKATLQRLSSLLSEKWHRPYSVVCGYVQARMSIAIVRATNRCLRGARLPARAMSYAHFPEWMDGSGFSLFRAH